MNKLNLVGKRYWYLLISVLIIVPGMIGLAIWGLPFSIDFTSGSLLELKFTSGQAPKPAEVTGVYSEFGFFDPRVQTSGEDTIIIRSKEMDEETKAQIVDSLGELAGSETVIMQFNTVGPTVGQEVTRRAAYAVMLAAIGILAYIWFAFRSVPHAHRYGITAIIAMLHDVAVVITVQVFLSRFLGWEVDSLFLTALLTIIGFSVHDSIVVFDRIRENTNIYRRLPFEEVVNHSIVQTLARSINTTVTVLLTLLALVLFGGVTIRHFVTILLVGMASGAYSSIFNASQMLVIWENREWKTWFHRKTVGVSG
jgi:preprotein translocase subunit SecF